MVNHQSFFLVLQYHEIPSKEGPPRIIQDLKKENGIPIYKVVRQPSWFITNNSDFMVDLTKMSCWASKPPWPSHIGWIIIVN
jgi:hypothetical protein